MEKSNPAGRGRRTTWIVAAALTIIVMTYVLMRGIGTERPVEANPALPTGLFSIGGPPMTTILELEIAVTPRQQERGLMGRDAVTGQGMAFPWNGAPANFWMRGTRIPLDIVYVGTDGRVESVTRAEPFDETGVGSNGNVSLVIEVPAGRARFHGLKPGAEVRRIGKSKDGVTASSGS